MNLFTTFVLFFLLYFTSNSYLFQIKNTAHFRGLLYEEKTRLGSTPPSCHNKCNVCHPCMAVQVPTVPGGRQPAVEYYDGQRTTPSSPGNNRYSNYKPLGWKCRCGGHLYNP